MDDWRTRVWREFRVNNLTRAYRDVLLTLATFRGQGGRLEPSHATLASRAGCSVRTVQRALWMAEQLGLVAWSERRYRAGWRWLRTSNSYRLLVPDGPVRGESRRNCRRFPTTGHMARGGEKNQKKEALEEMMREASGLPDLLAMRRAAFQSNVLRAGLL